MILIFEITCLVSLDAKRTSFSTERTTVWFLHYTSKSKFCLLLWTLTGSFKSFLFPSTVPSARVQATVSARQWGTKVEPLKQYSTCSKFSSTVHWHVLRKKPHLPVIYKIILCLHWQFCKLPPCFCLCNLKRNTLNAHHLQLKFLYVWTGKTNQSPCTPNCIVTEICS